MARLHPILCALISFPLGHVFGLLLGVPECRIRWVAWVDSYVSLLNSIEIITLSVFELCRVVLLSVLSERHCAYSVFCWLKNLDVWSRAKIKWEENQILSHFLKSHQRICLLIFERGKKEKEIHVREKPWSVASLMCCDPESNPQLGYGPWQGIKPTTIWWLRWHANEPCHLARAPIFFRSETNQEKIVMSSILCLVE